MYARLAEKLADTGWRNCIPLIPRTKQSLVPWRAHRVFTVTDEQRADWVRRYPDAGIGYVIEPGVVAAECDSLDATIAEAVASLSDGMLGPTPLVRIGKSPKWMRFFAFDDFIPKIAAHPIEVIPASYHVVLYGIHGQTGRPYFWPFDEPLHTPPETLPRITRAQVDRFLAAALEVLPSRRSGPHLLNGDLFERLRAERAGRIGMAWLAVIERQLREARHGELHDVLLSVTAALVGVGYNDAAIHRIVEQHFQAPRSGPYASVWKQIDDAIAGARRRWTPPPQRNVRLEQVPA
jgi:hypothetical protein